ncbi:MAG: HesA/MoeB/ThiF family protein [archaeon]
MSMRTPPGVLKNATATIIGVGVLGTRVAKLLVESGIGRLVLVDRDIVEEDNLERQELYSNADVGKPKVIAAQDSFSGSETTVTAVPRELTWENADTLLPEGIIIDCTDNFEARYIIDRWCRKHKRPWVHGAAAGSVGNAMLFIPDGPCFFCIFRGKKGQDCGIAGILPETASIVAATQAQLAIDHLLGLDSSKGLLRVDAQRLSMTEITVAKREDCPGCADKGSPPSARINKMCSKGLYQTKLPITYRKAKAILSKKFDIKEFSGAFSVGPFTVFSERRVLIKAATQEKALALLEKHLS